MDIGFDFFKIDERFTKPARGRILISEPYLGDEYFKRTVIFLTEHNQDGTVGFVLNKPVKESLSEIVSDFPDVETRVSVGGPVATDTVHYLHTLGELVPGSIQVFRNIWWGGDFATIKDLMGNGMIKNEDIRFFVGYSGWSPGQLDQEIGINSWVIADMEPRHIMQIKTEGIWKQALNRLGSKYKLWTNFPESPDMN